MLYKKYHMIYFTIVKNHQVLFLIEFLKLEEIVCSGATSLFIVAMINEE